MAVEANCSILADCYINLMKIAAAIQNLSVNEYKGFQNYCIEQFNSRFEEFNDPIYQLTYFLHLAYKGIGLKFGTLPLIANYAGKLWQQMGKMSKSCETLITQLQIYKEQKKFINGIPNLYTAPYTIGWIYGKHQTRLNIDRLEGLAKVYRFNLSNPIGQLRYTQATEVTPEIMINIAETVFK
ncbi:2703_t:CDS:2, partial [Gigaspora rosea]